MWCFFDEGSDGLRAKLLRGVGIEEHLKELAEKRVQCLVPRSERNEVRPTSCYEVSDLRAECDVVFDKLVSGFEKAAHADDFRRWQLQTLKAVAVGSESIGEHKRVTAVILGTAHRMPVAEAVDLLGVDGENGDAAVEQGLDDSPMGFFDRHRDAFGLFAREVQEPLERRREPVEAVREASFR